ncbi:MAG: hypothetical protein H6716_08425 [Polyangiaceae bacterium]|nr:hypothetical protein [Polyangiaceae bacterium]
MSDERLNASSELGRLVGSARVDAPSAEAIARMAARLPVGPPPAPTDGSAGAGASGSSVGLSAAAKLVIAVGISLGLGAGGYALLGGERAPSATPRLEEVPEQVAPPVEEPKVVAPSTPAPTAEVEVEQKAPVEVEAPQKASKPAGPSEASILERARRNLSKDPSAALAATQEHKRLYPSGVLAQEREVIAIEALKRLKREGEAKSRAETFEAEHPESAHQRKVESILDE